MFSFWRILFYWLLRKLSSWQLPVDPVTQMSSKWRFHFSGCFMPSKWKWENREQTWQPMMAPWHGNAFHITGPLWGESTAPSPRRVMRSSDVSFDLRLNKQLNSRVGGDLRRHIADVTSLQCYVYTTFNSDSWWRHQMETFSALLAICAGNSSVPGEFPSQRPVTRSFDVFFDLRLNKRLSKQSWGWWFETLWSPLWRHSNVMDMFHLPRIVVQYSVHAAVIGIWNHSYPTWLLMQRDTLRVTYRHFDEIFFIGCTGRCYFDDGKHFSA